MTDEEPTTESPNDNKDRGYMRDALKAADSTLDALFHSNWYEEYFYDTSRLLPIVDFIDTLSAGRSNLTFVELFAHTGVVSHTVLKTLPRFEKADLYELDPKIIQRGKSLAHSQGVHLRYFRQDLGKKIRRPVAQNAVIYIGEESHEYLHTRRQLDNLAHNCAALLTSGSQLIIKWISFKSRNDAFSECRSGRLLDAITITKDATTHNSFLVGYYVDAYDPLRQLITYQIIFQKNGREESLYTTMRYWTLAEITEAFDAFDFALHCHDGKAIVNWHADYYDQELYLVGTRK